MFGFLGGGGDQEGYNHGLKMDLGCGNNNNNNKLKKLLFCP
jgi:hypothetical protein